HSGLETFAPDTCRSGGALTAAVGEATRTANGDIATWAFTAPALTTLVSATLWRAGDADGGTAGPGFYQFWFAGPVNLIGPETAFGRCPGGPYCLPGLGTTSVPLAPDNVVVVPGANLGGQLYANASCVGVTGAECPEGSHDGQSYAAVVYIYAADLILEQTAG